MTVRPLTRAFRLLAPHWRRVAVGMIAVPIAAAAGLWFTSLAADAVAMIQGLAGEEDGREGAANRLLVACAALLGLAATEAGARYVARRKLIDASRLVEEQLKNDLMAHIGRLPIAWFDRARTGDLISRLTQDVELLRFLVGPALLYGGAALIIVPGGLWMMASTSWSVFAAAIGAFGLLVVGMGFVLPRMRVHGEAVQESIGHVSQRCAEDFAGIGVIGSFGRARAEAAAMAKLCEEYLGHNVRLARTRASLDVMIHGSRELVVLGVLVVGALEAIAGRLTVPELFMFLLLLEKMMWPLLALGWIVGFAHRAIAAGERVEEIFAVEPQPDGGATPELRGRVTVRDLTFSYEGQEKPALRDVSFTLEPGQKLGLVGAVGSGKSTLLALLLRLYEPPPGTVFVDGFDVRELAPDALRRAFAVAPQDPFLFSDTIRGNVAFGAEDTESPPLGAAVHASAVDQDIDAWPEGLESIVGERGVTLSGGQKQRVSLARALASERPTLLLDDTLSAVDHGTEDLILERLGAARSDRTMIVATHRFSAVRDADLILVLDDGAVAERGTHDELVAAGGAYAAAFGRQRERDALEGEAGA